MKSTLYIFILLIMVSCKNESVKSSNDMDYVTEDSEMNFEEIIVKEAIIKGNNETFEHKALTTEKLQELYDVLTLLQKHPEFNESLTSQLKTYTKDSISVTTNSDLLIDNLRLKGDVLKLSDSSQRMKLEYNITSKDNRTQDSIWAKITFKTLEIEGKKVRSKKIAFESIK